MSIVAAAAAPATTSRVRLIWGPPSEADFERQRRGSEESLVLLAAHLVRWSLWNWARQRRASSAASRAHGVRGLLTLLDGGPQARLQFAKALARVFKTRNDQALAVAPGSLSA